tara:strand:+ start:10239 stop:11507 length:1269 start_codon:yes stop_codon:yes gene_type:complete
MLHAKDLKAYIGKLGKAAKEAAEILALTNVDIRNQALLEISSVLDTKRDQILEKNKEDLIQAKKKNISDALIDRLELTDERVNSMISGLRTVSDLPDPVGEITSMKATPSGIKVSKMRVPLGVIGIIYESRPNVTADAAALCIKSGNTCILKGGSESMLSNTIISECLQEGINKVGLPENSVQLINTTDREAVKHLLQLNEFVDVIIPRGGKGLVKLISEESRVPVIKHLDGICHVYIDDEADLQKGIDISFNAKTYRYGICGAMETLLINKEIAEKILPQLCPKFLDVGVELRGCQTTIDFFDMNKASSEDWVTEYLGPILSIKIVDSLEEAISHINKYGSSHSDSIVTENHNKANMFMRSVDSSSVMHNVPTCWADGFEYGLGAEVGISTDKIHARGPVGLEGLTSQKFLVEGNNHLRGD